MDPKTAQPGAFNVRRNLRSIVESKDLQPVLDRFHKRLSEMSAAISLDDGLVKVTPGASTSCETASKLLVEHVISPVRFEGTFDVDLMQTVAEIGKELNARRAEILSSRVFLVAMSEMLSEAGNADDAKCLARVCLSLYSSTGANVRMASRAEIEDPELIIEMTRPHVDVLLSLKVPGFMPHTDRNVPITAPAKPVAAEPVAKPPKPPVPRVAGGEATIEMLQQKLRELGATEQLIDEVGAGKSFRRSPAYCIKNIDAFMAKYGHKLTLIALHKNRSLLLGKANEAERTIKDIRSIAHDKALLHKYERFIRILKKKLDAPRVSTYPVVATLNLSHMSESLAIENLTLLVARVPKDKLRHILLSSPHHIATGYGVNRLLERYKQDTSVDSEKLIADISAELGGSRPSEFIRAYVLRNLDSMSSRTIVSAKKKVDYAGRTLFRLAREAGIPAEFAQGCMERGMISFKDISAAFKAVPVASPQKPVAPPQPEARPSAPVPGPQKPAEEMRRKDPAAAVAQPHAPHAVVPDGRPPAETAAPQPYDAPAPKVEPEKKLEAALGRVGLAPVVSKRIMDYAKTNGNAHEALERFEQAIVMITQKIHEDKTDYPLIRSFFGDSANVTAFIDPNPKVLTSRIFTFSDARSRSVPAPNPAESGGVIRIPPGEGDEAIMKKIQDFPVPQKIKELAASYHLDAHDLIYVTMKTFRWLNDRKKCHDVLEAQYRRNVRNNAGDAKGEVSEFLRRMTSIKVTSHEKRVVLRIADKLEAPYSDFAALLHQVHRYLHNGN